MSDLLERIPYARFLNLQTLVSGDEITVILPFADRLIGNPMLPALHGGSTAALLEMTAMAQVALAFP
ncbi:MAG: PaaI family thioesterase, partial [Brevundimonas mediterranea]